MVFLNTVCSNLRYYYSMSRPSHLCHTHLFYVPPTSSMSRPSLLCPTHLFYVPPIFSMSHPSVPTWEHGHVPCPEGGGGGRPRGRSPRMSYTRSRRGLWQPPWRYPGLAHARATPRGCAPIRASSAVKKKEECGVVGLKGRLFASAHAAAAPPPSEERGVWCGGLERASFCISPRRCGSAPLGRKRSVTPRWCGEEAKKSSAPALECGKERKITHNGVA